MKTILALDIGGTFLKMAISDLEGNLLETMKIETPSSLENLLSEIEKVLRTYNVEGIAISSPGSIERDGMNKGHSAVPYLYGVNLKYLCEKRFKKNVSVENDGNCAAFAELMRGSGKGRASFICIVIGTGIGGGIVINGEILYGANLHAGEFGYMLIGSPEGNTWSETGSASALIRKAGSMQAETLFNKADLSVQEDKALDHFFTTLATGIFSIQYMLDPEAVLIGGGISQESTFLDRLNAKMEQLFIRKPYASIRPIIKRCSAGSHAQLIGAIEFWKKQWESEVICLPE